MSKNQKADEGVRLVVFLSGGLIGSIVSDKTIKEVVVVDDDVEGRDDEDVTAWVEGNTEVEGYFYSGSFELNPDLVEQIYKKYHED